MSEVARVSFRAPLVLEYSSSPVVTELGEFDNEMVFFKDGDSGYIQWDYTDSDGDEDETIIGLTFEGNELVDYYGVFELPKEAVQLINRIFFRKPKRC